MKYLIIVVATILAGCSSSQKQPAQSSTSAPASAAAPATATATSKAPASTAAKATASNGKSQAPGPAKTTAEAEKLTCAKGKESRTLEIVKMDSGCELKYTKSGKSSTFANSAHGNKRCETSESKLRAKLEKSGFQCKPT